MALRYAKALPGASIWGWGDSFMEGARATKPSLTLGAQLADSFSPDPGWSNQGVGGQNSSQILARQVAQGGGRGNPTMIWSGRNNFADPTQVRADVNAMIANLTSTNYVVLPVINASTEPAGGATYIAIATCNAGLLSDHPDHFKDIRAACVAAYNPANPIDVINFANDCPPFTRRAPGNPGGALVGAVLAGATSFTANENIPAGYVMTIGSEYILVLGSSGNNVTSCTRGYAGTTPAGYSDGQTYVTTQDLHWGDGGYTIAAQTIYPYAVANHWIPWA